MKRSLILLVLLFLALSTGVASSPERAKQPWDWTDEERLGVRFDPVSIRERSAARQATSATAVHSSAVGSIRTSAAADLPNFISGARNPELFMPFELFSTLIDHGLSADPDDQQMFRQAIGPVIAQTGLKAEAFWASLEVAARSYISSVRQEHVLALKLRQAADDERTMVRQQISAVQQPQCALRATALESATKSLGRTALYRVLYEGIAPTMTVSSPATDTAARYRFVAGGCR